MIDERTGGDKTTVWNDGGITYTGHIVVGHTAHGDVVIGVEAGEKSGLVRMSFVQAEEFHRLLGMVIADLRKTPGVGTDGGD